MAEVPGRRAVVIGGSRGIGRAVVASLAADGYEAVATGRDAAALDRLRDELAVRDHAVRTAAVRTAVVDATDPDATAELAAREDPVEVLVYSAGSASAAPLARTTLATWERELAVNATGAFLALQAFVPRMVARGSGRVVVITSTAALSGSPYITAYAASKHAAQGLVRAAAAEVAGTGVTINAVCPHFVRTDMTAATLARIERSTGRSATEAQRELEATSRLGRLLDPEEVAAAVRTLVADDTGAINGHALVLDGGGHW
jgi:NAD(P)-dependent dehydrogenase (short-subunit alcohol dehydrogenase family)